MDPIAAAVNEAALRQAALDQARRDRDAAVCEAIAAGATAYRVAKSTGLAESTISRLICRTPTGAGA